MTPPGADPISHAPVRRRRWKPWQNPIFARYCRSRLRPRGMGIALLITILAAGFLFFLFRTLGMYRMRLSLSEAERGPIIPLMVLQAIILFLLGTGQAAGGMTAEADEGVIDYQRLAPMTPLQKVLGYLFGLPVREYVMFFSTLPFTAWALWRGQVAAGVWMPFYAVFLTSAILYHLTGLVAGTVIKNRRWAFLLSMGAVFLLYTVIPQLARFGLVFFKYLTVGPVFQESLPAILPDDAGAGFRTVQNLVSDAKFFNLDFPEAVFTVFCQSGLILTLLMILWRRWRRAESLLLGKFWAAGMFAWIQILLLGNALPQIHTGNLFPSRELSRIARIGGTWAPEQGEALIMSGLYGMVSLVFMLVMITAITPPADVQIRGWRRARKRGAASLRPSQDAATAFWFAVFMALAGAAGWFVFTRAVVESRWFPGHVVSLHVLGTYAAVMLTGGMAYHALLEGRGGRAVGLAVILAAVAPLLIGAVVSAISDRLIPTAAWLTAISPLSMPFYACGSVLSIADLPVELARPVPRAFWFWLGVSVLVTIWLVGKLRRARKALAVLTLGPGMKHPGDPDQQSGKGK